MSFYENIDDEAWLRVNGELVLDNAAWNTPTSGRVDFGEGGWYDFELRLGNGTGGAGPAGLVGDPNWFWMGSQWKYDEHQSTGLLPPEMPMPRLPMYFVWPL